MKSKLNNKNPSKLVYYLAKPLLKVYLKKRITTRVLIVKNNQVLVIKNAISSGHLSLPGGGLKKKEQPQDALVREVKEEVGIDLEDDRLIYKGIYFAINDGLKYRYHLWFYKLVEDQPIIRRPVEIIDAFWIDIAEVSNYKISSELTNSLQNWLNSTNLIK